MKRLPKFVLSPDGRHTALALTVGLVVGLLVPWNYAVDARDLNPRSFRSDEEERTIEIYRKTNEAVVFITTITLAIDPFDMFLEYRPRQGTGSGVIVDEKNGIILTNLHVIGDADRIEVTLADGRNYRAVPVGVDKTSDLAVLRLAETPSTLVRVSYGESSSLVVGQRVLAIGNPFGLHRTLTTGIVSSLERNVKSPTGALLKGLIQTDAAINPGNSGGPLLDMDGRLIGINTAILSQSGDSAGISFALPIDQIRLVLPDLLAHGRVRRADLGWVLIDTTSGPMVLRIIEGGAAEAAKIQPVERPVAGVFLRGYVRDVEQADVIVAVNDRKVENKEQVQALLNDVRRGDKIRLLLRRGGRRDQERVVEVEPQYTAH